jgi:integrase
VRQSAKRERIPDVLEVEEFQRLQAELRLRERILVWLDMTLGLRRGELRAYAGRTFASRI